MSNPFDKLQAPVKRLHQQAGHAGTVYNYTQSSSGAGDWHDDTGGGDDGWTEDAGTSITLRVETEGQAIEQSGQEGRTLRRDVILVVDPDEATFVDGEADDERASEIVDGVTGTRYRVKGIQPSASPLWRLDADRLSTP
jgi:hypothetical protein